MKANVNGHQFTWEKQLVQNQGPANGKEGLKVHAIKTEL